MKTLFVGSGSPISTASHYESAFRRRSDVVTCGPSFTKEQADQWYEMEKRALWIRPEDALENKIIPCLKSPRKRDFSDLPDIQPDLVVWVDSGDYWPDLSRYTCTKVALMGDTHVNLDVRQEYAKQFDRVYAQFHPCLGEWLGPACSEIHRGYDVEPLYDVVFVGQTSPFHQRRNRLIGEMMDAGLKVRVAPRVFEEAAMMMSRGKVVFNCSLNGDMNMRVIEGMASGRPVVTDALDFDMGVANVYTYTTDLLEVIAEADPEMGKRGQQEAFDGHTYDHKVERILSELDRGSDTESGAVSVAPGPAAAEGDRGDSSLHPAPSEQSGPQPDARRSGDALRSDSGRGGLQEPTEGEDD